MNENRNPEATPDQLLQMLDMQLTAVRNKRGAANPHSRVVLLVGGLLLILAACGAALLFLQQMLFDLPRPSAEETPPRMADQASAKNL
jgi:hypothetical protein